MKTPVYQQLIGVDESVARELTLNKQSTQLVNAYGKATTATNFTLSVSNDGTNFVVWDSASSVTDYKFSGELSFSYVKLSSDAAGTSGTDTVTLILTVN